MTLLLLLTGYDEETRYQNYMIQDYIERVASEDELVLILAGYLA